MNVFSQNAVIQKKLFERSLSVQFTSKAQNSYSLILAKTVSGIFAYIKNEQSFALKKIPIHSPFPLEKIPKQKLKEVLSSLSIIFQDEKCVIFPLLKGGGSICCKSKVSTSVRPTCQDSVAPPVRGSIPAPTQGFIAPPAQVQVVAASPAVHNRLSRSYTKLLELKEKRIHFWETKELSSSKLAYIPPNELESIALKNFLNPENEKKVLLLLGEGGIGKSLFLQCIENQFWNNWEGNQPIPLYILLSQLENREAMISEVLKKEGFSDFEINNLKNENGFILFLDEYDEFFCHKNLYEANKLYQCKIGKVIISCRARYLDSKVNYKRFFAPLKEDGNPKENLFTELRINEMQFEKYLEFCSSDVHQNCERFFEEIGEDKDLCQLFGNPYIFSSIVDILPEAFAQEQNIKIFILENYLEKWFAREAKKYQDKLIDSETKNLEQIKEMFSYYTRKLAFETEKENSIPGSRLDRLFPNEEKIRKIYIAALPIKLKEKQKRHYVFSHKLLRKYFLGLAPQNVEVKVNVKAEEAEMQSKHEEEEFKVSKQQSKNIASLQWLCSSFK